MDFVNGAGRGLPGRFRASKDAGPAPEVLEDLVVFLTPV
jgi:hypothetical protein